MATVITYRPYPKREQTAQVCLDLVAADLRKDSRLKVELVNREIKVKWSLSDFDTYCIWIKGDLSESAFTPMDETTLKWAAEARSIENDVRIVVREYLYEARRAIDQAERLATDAEESARFQRLCGDDASLRSFYTVCKQHDWYYSFSDDGGVWRSGEAAWQKLAAEARLFDSPAHRAIWAEVAPKDFKYPV